MSGNGTRACPCCKMQVPADAYVCAYCKKQLRTGPVTMGCTVLVAISGAAIVASIVFDTLKTQSPQVPARSDSDPATPSNQGGSEAKQQKEQKKETKASADQFRELKTNGRITKLILGNKQVSLGMTYQEFEGSVPQSLFSSTRASDGVFVLLSPDGVQTQIS